MARRSDTGKIPLKLIGEYPDRWERSTLGEACALVTDGTHDSPKEASTGFPLVTGKCITGGRVNLDAAYLISDEDHQAVIARSKPEAGDILFANIGDSIGELARVETTAEFSIKNVALFKPGPRLESLFLKYYLQSGAVQSFVRSNTFGSAQPFIGLGTLRGFPIPIPIPPLPEQKAIARILGSLDDKIELNRRMNGTLEAMARALFQSWFVDFDPVHAKAASPSGLSDEALAKLGMDSATAALFPSAFQASELGDIPKGWTAGTFGDVATNPRRSVQPNEIAPNTSYIALEHMPRRSIALGDWEPSAEVESGKTAFQKGEILFGKLRPYFHKVGVAPVSGVCSTDILVLAPTKPDWFGFLLGHASSDAAVHFADKHSTGTKMPRTNWTDLSSFKMALPHPSIAKAFNDQIQPIIGRIQPNLHQSRTLATLRDTLLPKLLSGELSVASTSMKASA